MWTLEFLSQTRPAFTLQTCVTLTQKPASAHLLWSLYSPSETLSVAFFSFLQKQWRSCWRGKKRFRLSRARLKPSNPNSQVNVIFQTETCPGAACDLFQALVSLSFSFSFHLYIFESLLTHDNSARACFPHNVGKKRVNLLLAKGFPTDQPIWFLEYFLMYKLVICAEPSYVSWLSSSRAEFTARRIAFIFTVTFFDHSLRKSVDLAVFLKKSSITSKGAKRRHHVVQIIKNGTLRRIDCE